MEQESWLTNKQNGVHYLTAPLSQFEAAYSTVRTLENRLLSDDEVVRLPHSSSRPMEWEKRTWTLKRFENFLQKTKRNRVLDIGCGNGWFTQRLCHFSKEVYGLDVGQYELEQAARCFQAPTFICCSDWSLLPAHSFDLITFNGSLQYFQLNEEFWQSLFRLLTPNGIIHVLDTPIYTQAEVSKAKGRSLEYFTQLGVPNASDYYQHLTWSEFPSKQLTVHYQPSGLLNRLNHKRSPFPWVSIQAK